MKTSLKFPHQLCESPEENIYFIKIVCEQRIMSIYETRTSTVFPRSFPLGPYMIFRNTFWKKEKKKPCCGGFFRSKTGPCSHASRFPLLRASPIIDTHCADVNNKEETSYRWLLIIRRTLVGATARSR
ncbi:hypothetical protein TNCT_151081 [Trichonephila clavata]|uniref:Uncharacterized protein n=1 Tax=Trichonephila clavata TaxID=2740835 RepID=A0A8X6FU25_TRICU|nr:hypothetical protein TNCT_151081 [Trichonephila clavata]